MTHLRTLGGPARGLVRPGYAPGAGKLCNTREAGLDEKPREEAPNRRMHSDQ